jgi:hypothetical protein
MIIHIWKLHDPGVVLQTQSRGHLMCWSGFSLMHRQQDLGLRAGGFMVVGLRAEAHHAWTDLLQVSQGTEAHHRLLPTQVQD